MKNQKVSDAESYFLVYSPKNKTFVVAEQDKHGSLSWEGFANLVGTDKDDVKVSTRASSTPEGARCTVGWLGIKGYKEVKINDTSSVGELQVSDAESATIFLWIGDVLRTAASDASSIMSILQLYRNPDEQTLRWVADKKARIKSKLQEVLRSL